MTAQNTPPSSVPLNPSAVDPCVIELGTPEWCWTHLIAENSGSLSYPGSQGQTRQAVRYTATGRRISIVLTSPYVARHFILDTVATLEVAGTMSTSGARWVVRATATATLTGDGTGLSRSRLAHPSHHRGPLDLLLLTRIRVRGFFEVATS